MQAPSPLCRDYTTAPNKVPSHRARATWHTDKNIELELTKLQLGHEYDMENTILKAQLDQGTDANRAAIEEQRSINKLEGEAQSIALKLQGQKAALAVQDAKDRLEVNKKRALDSGV